MRRGTAKRTPRRRLGFSLIELSAVLGATAVAAGLLAATLLSALRIEKASAGVLRQMSAQHALADQFRADVALAITTPERWQENVAGPTCLILRIDDQRHVVYRWEENQLTRSSFNAKEEHRYTVALGHQPAAVEFGRSARLISLRLFTLLPTGDKHLSGEFSAALGGDRQ